MATAPAVPPAPPPAVVPRPADPDASPAGPAAPVRLRIPGLAVDAPVVDVGVDDQGRMDVPLDVADVGWYRFGPGPGATAGSAVLSGHVDDRDQGLGAFYRLGDLVAGDPVAVTLADGTEHGYRVRSVERTPKGDLPVDAVFARDGPARLTLVTCGGDFDRAAGGYTDNVVVTADPVR